MIEDGPEPVDGSRYHLDWSIQALPRHLLWRLAASAIDLLTRVELDRLARCGRCRWLFVDASRSHTRPWCTMNSCGAITTMRRYRGIVE
jgi:predicted RNA-binding Zn ribbon-like protein